jgi:exodeoxyribonuclease X
VTVIRVIDTETTGLEPTAKVVEWATFDLVGDGKAWDRGRAIGSLINPGIPIPPEASAIHHITDEDVKDAPTWTDQLKVITGPPTPDFWAAQNNRFDMMFFNPAGARWIDTYRCALAYWPDCPAHTNQCVRYWLKLKLSDPTLAVPHRAFGDAYVTAAIVRRLLSGGALLSDLVDVSSEPALLPRFTFGKHAMTPIVQVPTDYLEWVLNSVTDNEDVQHTAYSELLRRRSR